MKTMAFYNTDVKMKDSEINDMIRTGYLLCETTGDGALLSIDGYDQDPRDLWAIPEAVAFTKKLVMMGVCSVLTYSTTLDPRFQDTPIEGRPFGAFEIWLLAKGRLGSSIEGEELRTLFNEFSAFIREISNPTASAVIEGRVNDGQHRTEVK